VPVVMRCRANGGLEVRGDLETLEIYDVHGERIDVSDRKVVLLCRCGGSKQKPLCDGAHNRVGFKDEPAAR